MINWDRVSELRSEVGDDGFEEVVTLFLEETDEVVIRLFGQSDAKSIEADLHFLKGAALNLGFSDFAAFCQEGERSAARGIAAFDVDALQKLYDGTKIEFSKRLSESNAA